MEVFGIGVKIKEEGAATVEASLRKLGAEVAKTALTFGGLAKAMQLFVTNTAESQKVQAQLATALRSTNAVSGQTIDTLNEQAGALQRLTAFEDDSIGSAQALLLTFTNVRSIFADATKSTLDLAQAMGMDARSAAMVLGKALNDPVTGMATLRRVGVQLSTQQEDLVKSFVAVNDIASAQRIILEQLNTQVGGSAEAYRNTLGGALESVKNSFGNLFEASEKTGKSLAGTINAIATMLDTLRGPIQFVFTSFTNGLITIVSLVGQIGLAITRAFAAIGAAAVTFLGAFGTLLPGVGGAIGTFIDDLNAKVSANDDYFAGLQERLKAWRTEVVMGTTATGELSKALGQTAGGTTGAGAGGGATQAIAPNLPSPISMGALKAPGLDMAAIQAQIPQVSNEILNQALEASRKLRLDIQSTFEQNIGAALTAGIVGGIEQAVASGNISDGFKALTSMMLAGIGDAMIKFGMSTAAFSEFMAKIMASLAALNPAASLALSVAMIGIGAALKGAARGMFGGQSGGRAMSISSFGGSLGGNSSGLGAALPTTQLIFGQTSATTAAGMTPRQSMNVTVIGPNDPSAQRAIQELMTKANSRGRVG